MNDNQILEIRDAHLPSQGDQFDTLAFGKAVAESATEDLMETLRQIVITEDSYDDEQTVLGEIYAMCRKHLEVN